MARDSSGRRFAVREMTGSLLFPATTSKLSIPNTVGLRPGTGGFAVAFSLKPDGTTSATSLVQGSSSSAASFTIYRASPTQWNLYVQSGGASALFTPVSTARDAWTRVFVTFDHTDLKIRVYFNGVVVFTSSAIAAWNITGTNPTEVGATVNGLPALVGSSMADISFYKGTVPTPADVANDYFDGVQAPGCVHRYKLAEQTGTSAADEIAGNTATLAGATPPVWRTDAPSHARAASATRDTSSARDAT